VLECAAPEADVRIHYFNSDGTPAALCGNATLCSTAMAALLGIAGASGMVLTTPAGLIASRLASGVPEIDLQPVTDVRAAMPIDLVDGEQRIGFAVAGIPHLVILCENADAVDVARRGPGLRRHAASGLAGANVNWVSPMSDGEWRYRTFERGVEGETLACGTGAVATAVLLEAWGLTIGSTVVIRTSSRRDLEVRLRRSAAVPNSGGGVNSVGWQPTLRGEGRVVYRGVIEGILVE
jgi:diaminopimelate epimerase